jgi:hypothetical protein
MLVQMVARLPTFILRRLYSRRKLRGGIAFHMAPSGVSINPKLAELDVALTVRSRFPVELIGIELMMTWNYTDYFTGINETLSKLILNPVTISFRKQLTTEEVSRVGKDLLVVSGDAVLRTNFAEFTKVINLATTARLEI